MFLKSSKIFNEKNSGSSLSIIAQGIDFSGEINTEGDIHLDGKMKGTIKAEEVVIGPEGQFEGEISANILVVSGNIKGKFTIKNLHVKKDGLIQGKAKYEVIVVDAGGNIQGELGIIKQTKASKNKENKESNNASSNNTSSSGNNNGNK